MVEKMALACLLVWTLDGMSEGLLLACAGAMSGKQRESAGPSDVWISLLCRLQYA